jgi:hypothetical protein
MKLNLKKTILTFGLVASAISPLLLATPAQAEYYNDRTSLVTPLHVNNQVDFIVRGSNIDDVKNINDDQFLQTVINSIKQADPVDWQKDFNSGEVRKIKIVNVKLNGFHNDNEVQLFSNMQTEDEAKDFFKARFENGEDLYSPEKNGTMSFTDENGNDYQIKTQLIFNLGKNQIKLEIASLTNKSTDFLAKNARDEIVIFYVHCSHGKDRTGVQSEMYLVNEYLKANANNIDKDYLTSLVSKGFIRWEGSHDQLEENGYNAGKKIYDSSFYETLADSSISSDDQLLPNLFPQVENWNEIVPDQDDLVAPAINDFAFTSPICKSGYVTEDNASCLTLGDNKISWKQNGVNLDSSLSHYSFYVAYLDKKGVPVELVQTSSPTFENGLEVINLPKISSDYTSVKLYATNSNGSPISITNKTKYLFVNQVS